MIDYAKKHVVSTVWKTLKVFVSSTFRDLELARDSLTHVFQGIEKELLDRQLALRLYDLRWRERHASEPLVDWCLKMVQECQYFIGILGTRYGWRPQVGQAGHANEKHISITEMEINTAIESIAPKRRFFCFAKFSPTTDESQEDIDSQEILKRRLVASGETVYECQSIEDLLHTIDRELRRILLEEFPEGEKVAPLCSGCNHDITEIIAEKTNGFVGRHAYLQQLHEFAKDSGRDNYLVIHASAGTGKSALLAKFIQDWSNDIPIIAHFTSMGGDAREVNGLMFGIGEQLRREGIISDILDPNPITMRGQVRHALQTTEKSLILVIDGLDEIGNGDRDLLWFPRAIPPNVRVILTTRPGNTYTTLQSFPQLVSQELPPLEDKEIMAIINEYDRAHLLKLSHGDQVLLWQRACGNPLFLKVALDEILSSGVAVAQLALTVDALFAQIMERLDKTYGTDMVQNYLGLIAASRNGIQEKELSDVLKIGDDMLIPLTMSLANFIVSRRGLLNFFHPEFERTVMMGIGKASMRHFHRTLAGYFKQKGYHYTRTLEELPYQLQSSAEHRELLATLTELTFLEAKCNAGLVNDLSHDFAFAIHDPATRVPKEASYEVVPNVKVDSGTLELIGRAIDMEIQFLRRYPESLFQALWNRCYWYDSPEISLHYEGMQFIDKPGGKLYILMEHWRDAKEKETGFVWLKSLRPLPTRLDSALLKIFRGHEAVVYSVGFSPGGRYVVSGSRDNKVHVWNMANGELLHSLCGHEAKVMAVEFSPDGGKILSASFDKSLRLWDTKSGELLRIIHTDHEMWSAKFSTDGDKIISGSQDNILQVWDVYSGELVRTFNGHDDAVWSVSFSPDGSKAASGSYDKTVRIWDVCNGDILRILSHEERVTSVAFSPDGSKLASGCWDKILRIWDVNSGALIHTLRGHEERICSVAFNGSGSRIVSGSYDKTIRVWDTESGNLLYTLTGHEAAVYGVAFNPDGHEIVSGSYDKSVRIWKITGDLVLPTLKGHKEWVWDIALSPEGKIASCGQDNVIKIWNHNTGEVLHTLYGHEATVNRVSFSPPNADLIASCSYDKSIRLWDARTGKILNVLSGHEESVSGIDFSSDGTKLVSASHDKTVRIWDVSGGKEVHILHGHEDVVKAAVFNCSGEQIASASNDKTVRVWESCTGRLCCVLSGHKKEVCCVRFSPDGKYLASGSSDTTIRIWETATGESLSVLSGHEDTVYNVRFSIDGTKIFSESRDKTIRIWESKTGLCLDIIHGQSDISDLDSFYPHWRVLVRGTDTIIENKKDGDPIAIFPCAIGGIKISSAGIITGYAGSYVYFLQLKQDKSL